MHLETDIHLRKYNVPDNILDRVRHVGAAPAEESARDRWEDAA